MQEQWQKLNTDLTCSSRLPHLTAAFARRSELSVPIRSIRVGLLLLLLLSPEANPAGCLSEQLETGNAAAGFLRTSIIPLENQSDASAEELIFCSGVQRHLQVVRLQDQACVFD